MSEERVYGYMCWHCNTTIPGGQEVWLDIKGIPVVWTRNPRPVSPAAYHPDCGEAFRTRTMTTPPPADPDDDLPDTFDIDHIPAPKQTPDE